jgi:type II secretory pathway component PulK
MNGMRKGIVCKAGRRQRASVLILALWVVFFLAALSVAIGSHVASVFSAAERLSARVQARAAAAAGAAQAAAVIMASATNAWDGVATRAWNRDERQFKDVALADNGTFSVVFVTPDSKGGAVTNSGVIGEDGKISLNTSRTNLLTALFMTAGGLGDSEAAALTAAVVAWRGGGGDEQLTAGAGKGYAAQTSPGGQVEDRRMAHIEELLAIDRVDAALFDRLRPFITVHGSGLVNINAAAPAVLEALGTAVAPPQSGGAVVSLVRKLVDFREAGLAFEKADYVAMRSALEQFAALEGDEGTVFTAMVAMLSVHSTAFGGTAYRGGPVAGEPVLQVDFVWDTQARRFVMWRER